MSDPRPGDEETTLTDGKTDGDFQKPGTAGPSGEAQPDD